jgi:protocatechuate 3,4-dioxygenase beta subunit
MHRLSLLLLLSVVLFGQTPPRPAETSVVAGHVLNAATGEPLAKATMTLERIDQKTEQSNWEQSYNAASDASGGFSFREVVPGRYRLRAKRNGFLDSEYGARTNQQSGTVLDLNHPQEIRNAELRLSPQGVISGRVLDADGDPMYDARIQLLRMRYANGRKLYVATRLAASNDLGEYRYSGVAPGRYYLHAEAGAGNAPLSDIQEVYVPAYYPGSTDIAGAAPIDIQPGTQLRAGDLVLHKQRTVTVRGHVVVNLPGVARIQSVGISRNLGHSNATGSYVLASVATVNSAGEFQARGLTPGSYTATASVRQERNGYGGSVKFDVGASDIENLAITVDEGLTITGRVVVEGETKEPLNGVKIRFSLASIPPVSAPSWQGNPLAKDLTFRETQMIRDLYSIEMRDLPDGFYVKRIRAGNLDVTYTGLDLRSGANGEIEVLLSPKAGAVSGLVQSGEKNEPTPGATIVLVPKEPERRELPSYYPQAVTDQYGRFALKSVPPGEYKAYAWEDVESTAWMDPDFMAPLAEKGTPVSVPESAELSIQTPLIPAVH